MGSGSGGGALDFAAAEQLSLAVGDRIGRLAERQVMPLDSALASTFATTDVQHGRTKSVQTREVHELRRR